MLVLLALLALLAPSDYPALEQQVEPLSVSKLLDEPNEHPVSRNPYGAGSVCCMYLYALGL